MMDYTSENEQACIEWCESLRQSAAVQLLRTWIKVGDVFMDYICKSSEQPLGKIERWWWRWEYQDTMVCKFVFVFQIIFLLYTS